MCKYYVDAFIVPIEYQVSNFDCKMQMIAAQ